MRTYLNIAALLATLITIAFIGSYDLKVALVLLAGIGIGVCSMIALIKSGFINGKELKGK